MSTATTSILLPETTLVLVRLGIGHDGTPYARPNSCEAWFRATDGDTVRFTCTDAFTVEFDKGDGTPFDTDTLVGERRNGFFEKQATLIVKEERTYRYSLTVAGERIDPDIVVKKDPR